MANSLKQLRSNSIKRGSISAPPLSYNYSAIYFFTYVTAIQKAFPAFKLLTMMFVPLILHPNAVFSV